MAEVNDIDGTFNVCHTHAQTIHGSIPKPDRFQMSVHYAGSFAPIFSLLLFEPYIVTVIWKRFDSTFALLDFSKCSVSSKCYKLFYARHMYVELLMASIQFNEVSFIYIFISIFLSLSFWVLFFCFRCYTKKNLTWIVNCIFILSISNKFLR